MTINELFAKYNNPVLIGKGGQKTVYKTVTYDDAIYALKIVRKFRDSTGNAVAGFHCQVQHLENF